jgi:PAS domain-containing protein
MHIVATIRDITEHKRIEDALKESERFVHSTFDALPEHICVLDETGTIVAVNKAWREFAVAMARIQDVPTRGSITWRCVKRLQANTPMRPGHLRPVCER